MEKKLEKPEANFHGLTVLALESRMAVPMERLIKKYGGVALLAPALKEVALQDNPAAFDFFERLEAGKVDLVILMTGVGLRTLLEILQTRFPKERVLKAWEKTRVVVRGPKPTQVCKMNAIPIAVTVPPPNTWQEILSILSEENLLAGKQVALLEYGGRDENFLEELKARGARVTSLQVYRWALPDDVAPLRQAVREILAGKVDLLVQTSAVQIDHLLQVAQDRWEELKLRRAFSRVGVVSIGPTTSAHLREKQIFPDLEVFPNKMENLVEQAALHGQELLDRKRRRAEASEIRMSETGKINPSERERLLGQSPMMRACRREKTERIPVWLMRQAGRYMAEYQLLRRGMDFLEFCKNPEWCTEATLTAVERLGVDAAIIFADILTLVEPMGVSLAFREGDGPVIGTPVRSKEDIEKLKPVIPEEDLAFTLQAIRQVRSEMHPRIPLIGFSGAPFTLASYMIEGKGSRNYLPTKTLMHDEPGQWHALMEKLTTAVASYLKAQAAAGCQILQVFDSWVGCLAPEDYREFVLPHLKKLFSELPPKIPTIHFGTGTAALLKLQKEAGGDVIGVDWRVEPSQAWRELGDVALQGNLDPVLLFCKPEVFKAEARRILEAVGGKPGFIFNLGHGILPETPVEHVMELVDFIHSWKRSC